MSLLQDITAEILISRHRLTPQQVNSISGQAKVPIDLNEEILKFELVAEFIKITDIITRSEIKFTPLKGPVLSYRLYKDPLYRSIRDIDLLINQSDVKIVVNIIKNLNYCNYGIKWPESKKLQDSLIKHTNQIAFIHSNKQIIIEIHWRLLKVSPISINKMEAIIGRNQTSVNFSGRCFSSFSTELELLYLMIHGGLHSWRRLKWLIDIDEYLKTQPIDWEKFERLVMEFKAGRLVALCKLIYEFYFPDGALIPCKFSVPLYMYRTSIKKIADTNDSDYYSLIQVVESLFFEILAFPTMRYKLNVIMYFFFIDDYFGKNKISNWMPLFYAFGFFRRISNWTRR